MPLRTLLACLGLVLASLPLRAQGPEQPKAPRVLGRTPARERVDPAERSVLEGLRWLVRHQQEDGSWSARRLAQRCDADACCADPKEDYHALYEPGLTALAVLAFEECGYGPGAQQQLVDTVRGKRVRIGDVVERGLAWLKRLQQADGSVTPEKAFSYNEALAALAFTAAFELTQDDAWRAPAQRSIDWLVHAQRPHPSGGGKWGWRYQSMEDVLARAGGDPKAAQRELFDSDTSITAWGARALARAKRAGLTVPDEALAGALAFTRWVTARDGGVGYIDPKGAGATVTGKNDHFAYHPTAMSALGMSTRMDLAPDRADPFFALAAARLAQDPPRVTKNGLSVDYYYWHAGTRALFEWDGRAGAKAAWSEWKRAVEEALLALQDTSEGACRRGGWIQTDRWAYTGGPVYTTAIDVLTLATKFAERARSAPAAVPFANEPGASEPPAGEPAEPAPPAAPTAERTDATSADESVPALAARAGPSRGEQRVLEASLLEGLRWLVRHQNPDGSWSATSLHDRCDAATPCYDPKERYHALYDEGATALALLAFLRAGYTHESKQTIVDPVQEQRHKVGEVVKNGLQWLTKRQSADGHFTQGRAFLYNEALATSAFVEAYARTRDRYWKDPAQKGVDFLQRAQRPNPSGQGLWGWRYQSREEIESFWRGTPTPEQLRELHDSDTSVTAWCVRALDAGKRAGLSVRQESTDGALAFLRWVEADNGLVGYIDPRGAGATVTGKNDHFKYHPTVMSALALHARLALGESHDEPFFELAAKQIVTDLPVVSQDGLSVDYYYWHAGTEALMRIDGPQSPSKANKYWGRWNKALVASLLGLQDTEPRSCRRGGWTRLDRWAYTAGPIYTTAMNVLTLETVLGFGPRKSWWLDPAPRALVGELACEFEFTKRDGTVGTSSELTGSVVLLDFFSPWMRGYPDEIEAARRTVAWHDDAPFALVGVRFVPSGDASEYPRWVRGVMGTWHTNVQDDLRNEIFERFDVRAFPTRIVIDAEGVIRGRDLTWEAARELVEQLVVEAKRK